MGIERIGSLNFVAGFELSAEALGSAAVAMGPVMPIRSERRPVAAGTTIDINYHPMMRGRVPAYLVLSVGLVTHGNGISGPNMIGTFLLAHTLYVAAEDAAFLSIMIEDCCDDRNECRLWPGDHEKFAALHVKINAAVQ